MQRENPFWLYQIDITQEIVVVGVIRERESRVALITIDCVRIHRPTADHGHAFVGDLFEHARAIRAWRTDQNFSGDIVRTIANVLTKFLTVLFVDARHLIDRAMQHWCQFGSGQCAKNLLCFAQGIAEQHWNFVVVDRVPAEGDDLGNYFFGRRQAITRKAVSGLHDQCVGCCPFRRFGRLTATQFEIAGVKQRIIFRPQKELS